MRVLVTGAAGYIGSNICHTLLEQGLLVLGYDDFSNSTSQGLWRLSQAFPRQLAWRARAVQSLPPEDVPPVDGVIHCAAYKYVGESVADPLRYWRNNLDATCWALAVCREQRIPLVFSSSAAVYGPQTAPVLTEDLPPAPASPYGWTKWAGEQAVAAAAAAYGFPALSLRYFNPVGVGPLGLGGSPKAQPQQLFECLVHHLRRGTTFTVHGADHATPDGTAQRDYVVIDDVAEAHVAALHYARTLPAGSHDVFNLGTGTPTSVAEVLALFADELGRAVPHSFGPRRPGDPASSCAAVTKASQYLGWNARRGLRVAVRSTLDDRGASWR